MRFFAPRPPFVFFTLYCRARSPLLNGRWNAQYLIAVVAASFDSSAMECFFPGMLRDGKKYPHGLNDFFSRECDVEGVSKATACLQPDWAADFPEILAGKCGRQRPLRAGRMLDIIILLWTSNIIRRGLYFFCFTFLIG